MTWYLETKRLKLRSIDRTDARNLYELNADPRVMEFLSPEYDTLEEAEAILPEVVARNERYGNQLGLFAAIEKGSEEFIGTFILRPDRHAPEDTKNLEIGYRLKQLARASRAEPRAIRRTPHLCQRDARKSRLDPHHGEDRARLREALHGD